jgi:membrane protease subunit HflK
VPEAVIPSQRDANKALADQERFIKEAQAYANGILPVAEGAASRLEQDSLAYRAQVVAQATGQASRFSQLLEAYQEAPEVTRRRLYIETVEGVMSRAHKVIVDKGGANGNMFYLPLDKLMERSNTRDTSSDNSEPAVRVSPEPESVTVDGRTRGER